MESSYLRNLLVQVQENKINIDSAMHALKKLPFEDLGYASA